MCVNELDRLPICEKPEYSAFEQQERVDTQKAALEDSCEELDKQQRSTTPGDSGFETDQEIFHYQSSEFSEDARFDEPRISMDSNETLEINQCLEVVSKLSYASIVKKHLDIRK